MLITFPNLLALEERTLNNPIRQIGEAARELEGTLTPYSWERVRGFLFRDQNDGTETLIFPRSKGLPQHHARVLEAAISDPNVSLDLREGKWINHPLRSSAPFDHQQMIQAVLESWDGAFSYVEEDRDRGIRGLRPPQIGAVHAVHAHWAVSEKPATVVMPTGVGKTDTMIAILVSARCPRLLVVVPTDALRSQITEKFLTLGVLNDPGSSILAADARYPVVAMLQHVPRDVAEVDELFARAQVTVTTSSIAGQCSRAVQDRMAEHCPYLFIDEAHHIEAPTWKAFKERFRDRRVLQFTATPFREDGKPLDGDIIFKYPLKKAQQEGYFKPIRFRPVVEFNRKRSDAAIAKKAVEELRATVDKGHILMARVDSIARAKQVAEIYAQYPEFKPVELHTGIKSLRQREAARKQILTGESRIVICVDMLGEGFDLPELKIAAFHDIRKSLAVTLQLAGRFTRARSDLGDAAFIANTADVQVQEELKKLYARDPDWNALLPELSDRMIGEQLSLQEFLRGFTDFTKEIPLKTVRPAISTVVYRTKCENWTPEKVRDGIPAIEGCAQVHYTINEKEHTLVIVTARRVPLDWTDVESLHSWEWELYVVIWSRQQKLLFINSSSNAGEYRALARAIAGDGVSIVNGQPVFRSFAGVNRLRLQNVGLTEQLGRNVRYTGRMGSDVEPALTDLQRQRARKAVLSGNGYEAGEHVTVGASRKGRIWSHRRDRVDELAAWCKGIGAKLLDESIDPDEVLKGTLDAKTIAERPTKMPIAVDWPEEIYKAPESVWSVVIDGQERLLSEVDIQIAEPTIAGPLRVAVVSESERVDLELELFEDDDTLNYRFVMRSDSDARIRHGGSSEALAAFFYENPTIIWFADGSSLEGNQYVELKATYPPYDRAKITVWDWDGVNLRVESQGPRRDTSSIQARVIRELKMRDYAVIFDDDGKGEAADVVAIRLVGDQAAPVSIDVEFYHCKYSRASSPGQRVEDLYEVCGQAHKSVSWMSSPEKRRDLFTHLLRREALRQDKGEGTRFEIGDAELLQTIREMSHLCRVTLKIFIVQPGVSRESATPDQLRLMGVADNYLYETYQLPFGVIAND